MASNIPPKKRETSKQTYYTKGKSDFKPTATSFKTHIAEPGPSANILERNLCHYEERTVRTKAPFIRSGGYTPGLYAGRSENFYKDPVTMPQIYSISEAKLVKTKEFAE